MSQPTTRRYGPALTMFAAILIAAILAVLAPFNMLGSWTQKADPWDRISAQLLSPQSPFSIQPEDSVGGISTDDLVLLESDPERDIYFFGAKSQQGNLMAGMAGSDGVTWTSTLTTTEDTIEGGIGGNDENGEPSFYFRVQADPDSPTGFRHRLLEFRSSQQMQDFMEGLPADAPHGAE